MPRWLCFLLAAFLAGVFFWNPAALAAKKKAPPPAEKIDLPTEDLRRLVELLEDEKRRKEFVRDLKTLIKLREPGEAVPAEKAEEKPAEEEAGPATVVQPLVRGLQDFSEEAVRRTHHVFRLAALLPVWTGRAADFLSNPANLADLSWLLLRILAGVLAGLGLRYVLRPRLPAPPSARPGPLRLAWWASVRLAAGLAPPVLVLVVVLGLFASGPVLPAWQEAAVLVLIVYAVYKAAWHLALLLAWPESA
ncbi:MAG: hypothetical protein AB1896_21825, partial [Thermodesulfobacteriota bacterium]